MVKLYVLFWIDDDQTDDHFPFLSTKPSFGPEYISFVLGNSKHRVCAVIVKVRCCARRAWGTLEGSINQYIYKVMQSGEEFLREEAFNR